MSRPPFVVRRLASSIPVLLAVTLAVFLLIHLVPGDPARTALGLSATPAAVEQLHQQWGLDEPLPQQYADFLGGLVQGDLGTSTTYDQSVTELVGERIGVTLWLVVFATLLVCAIAVPLALWASARPGGARDGVVRVLSVAGLGIPTFLLGTLLIQRVAIGTGLFPAAGFGEGVTGHVQSMFLPSLTIAVAMSPIVIRSLRAEIGKVAGADHVTTARSKGLSERTIRRRHVLRNALVPSITILAINVGFLVGGTIVVEQLFSLPGVGSLMIQAIQRRDFQVVQGVTLVLAVVVIVVNLTADLVHAWLDPRVRA